MTARILITGASGGFGQLMTRSLAARGHTVVAAMREADGKNRAAAGELRGLGAHIVDMDVTSDASVDRGVDEAIRLAGGLDVVINNAGVGVVGLQETFTSVDWTRLFDINVVGVQRVNRAALPHLREKRSGLLMHVSSLLGRMVIPFFGPYNATKHALEAMADNYRVELSGSGVESIIVEPGGYGTTFGSNLMRPSDTSRDASYGDFAHAPEAMIQGFEKNYKGPNAPDPQAVADAVVRLVETPRGTRPFRTVVDGMGMGTHVEQYNLHHDQLTTGIYTAMGMGGMLTLSD